MRGKKKKEKKEETQAPMHRLDNHFEAQLAYTFISLAQLFLLAPLLAWQCHWSLSSLQFSTSFTSEHSTHTQTPS